MVGFLGAEVEGIVLLLLVGEALMLAAYLTGLALARRHEGGWHHYMMLLGFLGDEIVFKPLMIMRAADVWGGFPWQGTAILPHLVADSAVLVLGITTILLGFRHRVERDGKMLMPSRGKWHRWLGRAFVLAWVLTFVMGASIFVDAYY